MKKEIFVSIGVDVDAVAGWLGSYGGRIRLTISLAVFLLAKLAPPPSETL